MAKKWQGQPTLNAKTLEPYCGTVNLLNALPDEMFHKGCLPRETNQEI
jgi:hypothetical protein